MIEPRTKLVRNSDDPGTVKKKLFNLYGAVLLTNGAVSYLNLGKTSVTLVRSLNETGRVYIFSAGSVSFLESHTSEPKSEKAYSIANFDKANLKIGFRYGEPANGKFNKIEA